MKHLVPIVLALIPSVNLSAQGQTFTVGGSDTAAYRHLIGKPLPDFRLLGMDSTIYSPESLRGKVVFIDFWFIGCFPCMRAMPHLNKIYSDYRDSAFQLLSIAPHPPADLQEFNQTDTAAGDGLAGMRHYFMGDELIEYPLVAVCAKRRIPPRGDTVMIGAECDSVSRDFFVDSYPTVVIADKNGIIRMMESGFSFSTLGEMVVKDGVTSFMPAPNDANNPPDEIIRYRKLIEELLAEE